MKLTLRNVQSEWMASPVPMLCDETGKPLPNQRHVVVDAGVDGVTTVTVTFVVGEEVQIIESK